MIWLIALILALVHQPFAASICCLLGVLLEVLRSRSCGGDR